MDAKELEATLASAVTRAAAAHTEVIRMSRMAEPAPANVHYARERVLAAHRAATTAVKCAVALSTTTAWKEAGYAYRVAADSVMGLLTLTERAEARAATLTGGDPA